MSREELTDVIGGALEVRLDEYDSTGVLRPVVRGRLVGGDRSLNTILVAPGRGAPRQVTLTSRHRLVYELPAPQGRAAALLADAA
ncbi:hypothetical protein ABZ234_07835 [Nocardiopsis sp. NPDC006198]|uniref:hypothetical protein n=1 Tax=Nocardiopsis sp. NPDC006198 TaxID=3154472 RepID=UPI0033ABE8FA